MRSPLRTARNYYGGYLTRDEEIAETRVAVAGGTGACIGTAAVAGTLGGWLYAIYLTAPLLPSLVLGGLAGVIVGYGLAERTARRSHGPGAVHLLLVRSNERLMTVRRYPTFRQTPLRSYPIKDMLSSTATPLPVGRYHRLIIRMSDGSDLDFIVNGMPDQPP